MVIITLIYRFIILFLTILIIQEIFKQENIWNQILGSLVIIPFILRFFMIK